MNKTCSAVITVVALTLGLLPKHSVADEYGNFEVTGVEDGDNCRAGFVHHFILRYSALNRKCFI